MQTGSVSYILSIAKALEEGLSPLAYKRLAIRKYGKTRGTEKADEYQRKYYESRYGTKAKIEKKEPEKKSGEKLHDPLKNYLKKEEEQIRKLEEEKKKKKKKKQFESEVMRSINENFNL